MALIFTDFQQPRALFKVTCNDSPEQRGKHNSKQKIVNQNLIIIIIIITYNVSLTTVDFYKYVRGFTSVAVPPILYVIVVLSKEG